MEWSKVTHHHDRIIILAGAETVPRHYFDNPKNVFIGVNNAAHYLPVDYFHTADIGAYEDGRIMDVSGVHYVSAPDQDGIRLNNCRPQKPRPCTKYIKRIHSGGISKQSDTLNSGWNSAYSAYNLAVLMEPKEIFIFGIVLDPTNTEHWYDNGVKSTPGRSYSGALTSFNALKQQELPKTYNCTAESLITSFEVINDFDKRLACSR